MTLPSDAPGGGFLDEKRHAARGREAGRDKECGCAAMAQLHPRATFACLHPLAQNRAEKLVGQEAIEGETLFHCAKKTEMMILTYEKST